MCLGLVVSVTLYHINVRALERVNVVVFWVWDDYIFVVVYNHELN